MAMGDVGMMAEIGRHLEASTKSSPRGTPGVSNFFNAILYCVIASRIAARSGR